MAFEKDGWRKIISTHVLKVFDSSRWLQCPGQCPVWSPHRVPGLVASLPMQIWSNDTSLPGGSSSQCLVKVHPAVIKIFSGRTGQKIYCISSDPRWPTGRGHVMGGFEGGDNQERAFHLEYMGTHNT